MDCIMKSMSMYSEKKIPGNLVQTVYLPVFGNIDFFYKRKHLNI